NEVLLAINGYRTLIDGRLHVGVQRTALAAAAHFTADQIEQDSGKVSFLGRAAGANRVRVEFPDELDDYNRTFGEANDEYDQNVRGRVVALTLSASGITRLGHARTLAQQVVDAVASNRRQVTFKTHWLGFMLSPGDGIEITDAKLGLSRYLGRVTKISENENNEVEITAIEHQPVRDLLAAATVNDEDDDADCAALATSAEYRHNLCMTPMHAAVYEDPDDPILVPMAALSPKTRLAKQIRIDYKFEDASKWTSLGKVDSSHGGFLAKNLSATAKGIVIDGQHGTAERAIVGDLPVVLCSHEALGVQTARAGGDEVALATSYVGRNQSFGVRRTAGQAWNARNITVQYAYRVHAIAEEEGCFKPALYLQGLDACDETPQNAYIPYDQVPSFPFYFHVDSINKSFLVKSGDGATDEPGAIYTDWRAIQAETAGCPSVCGCEVQVENGLATVLSDVKLRALGRFYDGQSWANGIVVMGDQTLQCELWDASDSYFYNRATLFYPLVNGKPVNFDNGQAFLDSRYGKPSWGLTRAPLSVKQGDRVSFKWECWNVSNGVLTGRVFGPVTPNMEPLGTHVTTGLPANAWYQVNKPSYDYGINFTMAGTVWYGAKTVIDEQFASDGALDPSTWDIRYLDMYEGTFSEAFERGRLGGSSQLYKSGGVLKIDTGKHVWMHYCGPDLNLGDNHYVEAVLQNPVGGDNNGNDNLSIVLNVMDNFPADLPRDQRYYQINVGAIHVQLGKGVLSDGQGGYTPVQHYVQIIAWGAVNNPTVLAEWRAGSVLSYPITLRAECANGKDYTVKVNGTVRLTYTTPWVRMKESQGFALGRWDTTALGGSASCAWIDDLKVWAANTPDSHNGTWWFYGTSVSGNQWWYNATNNQGWHLVMNGANSSTKTPAYWSVWHSDASGCEYKLVGSEGACSPFGVWTLEPIAGRTNCGSADLSGAVITITPG
ncbi:MAG: phage tail protein, partial [Bacillota bacterium]